MSCKGDHTIDLSQVTFRDRILPNQPLHREQFEGSEQEFYAALYETLERFSGMRSPEEEFRLHTSDQLSTQLIASSPIALRFLQVLILLKRPRRILEIGTFIGLSALSMARVLPENGRIVTIEKYAHCAELAHRNFATNGLDDKIELIYGDAMEVLRRFESSQRFDMIFLDGNKERYHEYFALLDPLLVPQGLLVVDDVLFLGDVLNRRQKTAKGLGARLFLEAVETRQDYQKILLPLGNGIMLLVKQTLGGMHR